MEPIILTLLILCVVLLAAVLFLLLVRGPQARLKALTQQVEEAQAALDRAVREAKGGLAADLQQVKLDLSNGNSAAVAGMTTAVQGSVGQLGEMLSKNQRQAAEQQARQLESLQAANRESLEALRRSNVDSMEQLRQSNNHSLETMRTTTKESMETLRRENNQKLDEIRATVDEKLQDTLNKRIAESFKTVSDQLEQVYKGLGEMQTLAGDVGSLKQVLSGVKTRGILGEIQLGAILEEILAPEQYETNVATIPGSRERVEYAVRLPGGDGQPVYLPIDSKFPGDTYAHLLDARESGDPAKVELALKALANTLKQEAKDIREKYVEVPYTTNFGILFLPFEGLYAEAVNAGMVEVLQREYQVNVAGPSTMAALLNSLQMGFRTLAIQKRSNEVWRVLGAVKTEFGKFEEVLLKMQTHLHQTDADLEKLLGTRMNVINRRLRDVQQLEDGAAAALLGAEVAGESAAKL